MAWTPQSPPFILLDWYRLPHLLALSLLLNCIKTYIPWGGHSSSHLVFVWGKAHSPSCPSMLSSRSLSEWLACKTPTGPCLLVDQVPVCWKSTLYWEGLHTSGSSFCFQDWWWPGSAGGSGGWKLLWVWWSVNSKIGYGDRRGPAFAESRRHVACSGAGCKEACLRIFGLQPTSKKVVFHVSWHCFFICRMESLMYLPGSGWGSNQLEQHLARHKCSTAAPVTTLTAAPCMSCSFRYHFEGKLVGKARPGCTLGHVSLLISSNPFLNFNSVWPTIWSIFRWYTKSHSFSKHTFTEYRLYVWKQKTHVICPSGT